MPDLQIPIDLQRPASRTHPAIQVSGVITVTCDVASVLRDVDALVGAARQRLVEFLDPEAAAGRRRERRKRTRALHADADFTIVPRHVVADAICDHETSADRVVDFPFVVIPQAEDGLHVSWDLPRLVEIALDRHWGIADLAARWLADFLGGQPDIAAVLGQQLLQAAALREVQKRALRWSVETASLTPRQRATHEAVEAATLRWRLPGSGIVLADATRPDLRAAAHVQLAEARRVFEQAKWLAALASRLPDDETPVAVALTPQEVLQLQEQAKRKVLPTPPAVWRPGADAPSLSGYMGCSSLAGAR